MIHRPLVAAALSCLFAFAAAACSSNSAPAPDPAPSSAPSTIVPPPSSSPPTTTYSDPPPTVPGTTTTPPTGSSTPSPTPTPTPSTCNVQTGNAACDQCLTQNCCAQVSACDADPDCSATDTCTAQCAQQYGYNPPVEQQCEQQCFAQHPSGGQKLNALYQCLGTTCPTQCPRQ